MASTHPDVSEFTKDWKRLRNQKNRLKGGVEARMLTNLAMYYGEHYITQARDTILSRPIDADDKNHLSLVFNLIKKATRRKIGRLWSANNEFKASPNIVDPKAFDQATVVNKLVRGLSHKLSERKRHWLRLWWLAVTGVVIEHVPWVESSTTEPIPAYDPDTDQLLWRDAANPDPDAVLLQSVVEQMVQGGATPERFRVVEQLQTIGDVGSHIVNGLQFFIDASVTSIERLGPDQACYIGEIKTIGWIRETFGSDAAAMCSSGTGKDLGIVQTRLLDRGPTVANVNMKDLIPAIQGSQGPDDPPMCLFLTRYQPSCGEWPRGRRSMLTPGAKDFFADDDTQYGEIPLVDFHYSPEATSFWSDDFITDMVPANKFLNKRMSQLGESANASIYEMLLLGGDLGREDIPTDIPGVVLDGLDEAGNPKVQALQRGGLPPWFLDSIKLVMQLLSQIGSSDLLDHKQFPGQIRGPLALPLLQEIIESEDGPLYYHLGEQLAKVHQMRVNRVKEYYPPIRTLHYTGAKRKDEVLVFHKEAVLKAGADFTITVDPSSLVPEFSALREARIVERLSGPLAGLYTSRRTGKLDFSKVAMDLKYTDDDADQDRGERCRELAQHLISRLWQGEALPPEIPYPFWDHDAMMDELESSMETTEWLEASAEVKKNFTDIYERHRQYLAAIQESQMASVQSQMMQGAIAQATQQAAAKAASVATDAALSQIEAQGEMARNPNAQSPPPAQTGATMARGPVGSQRRLV